MTQEIKLLIVSDMHVEEGKDPDSVKESWLSTSMLQQSDRKHPIEAFIEKIKSLHANFDYLINLGDVTNRGYQEGWVLGMYMLQNVKHETKVKEIVHIVGNHDICIDKDTTGKPLKQRKTDHLLRHTNNYPLKHAESNTSFWADGFCVYKSDNVLFLICNSEKDLIKTANLSDPCVFEDEYLNKIDNELKKFDGENLVRIALMHRHIIQHSDIFNNPNQNDTIVNGDKFIDMIKRHNFAVVIHGHKHIARIKTDCGIPVLASGSFASRQNVLEDNGDNLFHIVTIHWHDQNYINGFVDSYRYNNHEGWVSIPKEHSFPSHVGFGLKKSTFQFASEIRQQYGTLLDNKEFIPIDDVIKRFPEYLYMTEEESTSFLQELEKLGYTIAIFGSKSETKLSKMIE